MRKVARNKYPSVLAWCTCSMLLRNEVSSQRLAAKQRARRHKNGPNHAHSEGVPDAEPLDCGDKPSPERPTKRRNARDTSAHRPKNSFALKLHYRVIGLSKNDAL